MTMMTMMTMVMMVLGRERAETEIDSIAVSLFTNSETAAVTP